MQLSPTTDPVQPIQNGCIRLIMGPMFAGKTTELIRNLERHTFATLKCCVVKYVHDVRYGDDNRLRTHGNLNMEATVCCARLQNIHDWAAYDVIGIDEGQFYPDLAECCEQWANAGKKVVVAALDGTYQREPFATVMKLIPLAEKVQKLQAVCTYCKRSAAFTQRIDKTNTADIDIGGADKYHAVCRQCVTAHAD